MIIVKGDNENDYEMKHTEHHAKPSSPGLPARCLTCNAWYYTCQATSPGALNR